MNVTVEQLLYIIGSKEVEIFALKEQIGELLKAAKPPPTSTDGAAMNNGTNL